MCELTRHGMAWVRHVRGTAWARHGMCELALNVYPLWSLGDVTCTEIGRGAQLLHILMCLGAAMLLADVNWTVLFPFSELNHDDEPA
jgi:hypothetical protein